MFSILIKNICLFSAIVVIPAAGGIVLLQPKTTVFHDEIFEDDEFETIFVDISLKGEDTAEASTTTKEEVGKNVIVDISAKPNNPKPSKPTKHIEMLMNSREFGVEIQQSINSTLNNLDEFFPNIPLEKQKSIIDDFQKLMSKLDNIKDINLQKINQSLLDA